ncbi:unnamed protein product [Lepeophtheirus salmonis]|uniref:(salmon louse) hypothetical protein n=1 Tax=Lepeophtheirus salmonis TaxID=72036 RepID=A0A7R8H3E2_LEPSM|nr:unnamed protein product [Lepeophtheirus salmonis]CAF2828509.1 unnamed protein product [Lepeophtheirus salmonis]
MEVVEEQLQNASKNPTVPPRRVMLDISNKLRNLHCNMTSSDGSMRRMIQMRRQITGGLPPLPFPFEDVIQRYRQELDCCNFADYISKDDVKGARMLILVSSFGQRLIKSSSLCMADGKCPYPLK